MRYFSEVYRHAALTQDMTRYARFYSNGEDVSEEGVVGFDTELGVLYLSPIYDVRGIRRSQRRTVPLDRIVDSTSGEEWDFHAYPYPSSVPAPVKIQFDSSKLRQDAREIISAIERAWIMFSSSPTVFTER